MKIEVSVGEIVDKLSILQIKTELIKDEEKLYIGNTWRKMRENAVCHNGKNAENYAVS